MSNKINDTSDLTSEATIKQSIADPDQKPKFPRSLSFHDNDNPSGTSNLKSPFSPKQNRIKKEQQSRRRSNSGLTNKDAYKIKLPNPRPKSIIRDSRALNKNNSIYSDDSEDLDEVDPRPRSSSHQVGSSPPSAPSSSEEKGVMVDIFPQISMGLQQKYLELKSDMSQLEEKTKAYEAELDLLQNSKTINQLTDLRYQMESVLFSSESFANSAPNSLSKNSSRFGSLKNTNRPLTPSFFRPPSSNGESRPQSPTPYLPGRTTQNLLVDLQNITDMGSKLVVEVSELKSKAENEVSKRSRTEAKLHQIEDKLVHFSALEEKLRQSQEDLWKECQVNEKHSAKRHELESHVNVLLNHEKTYKSKIEANNEEIERLRLDIQALKDANLEIQSKFDLESANHRKSMVSSARESRLLQEKIRTLEKEISDLQKVKPLTLVQESLNSTAPESSPLPSPALKTSDHNNNLMIPEDPTEATLPPLNYNSEALNEKNSRLVKTLTRADAAKKRYKKKVDEQQKLLEQCRIKIQQLTEGAVSQGPSEDEAWDLSIAKLGQISGSDYDSLSEVEKSSESKLLPTIEPLLNSGIDVTKYNSYNSERGQLSGSDSSQGKSIRRSRMPRRRQVSHSPPTSSKGEGMNDLQSQLLEKSHPPRKTTRKLRRSSSSSSNASSVNRSSAAKTFATELLLSQSLEASPNSTIAKIAQIVANDFSIKSSDYNSSPISPIPQSLAPGDSSFDSNFPELSEADVNVIAQKIIKELRESQSPTPVPVGIALNYNSSPIPGNTNSSPDKIKFPEFDAPLNSSLLFSNIKPTKVFCNNSTLTTIDSKPASSLEPVSRNPSTLTTDVIFTEPNINACTPKEDQTHRISEKENNNPGTLLNQKENHTTTDKSLAISAPDQSKNSLLVESKPSLLIDHTQTNDKFLQIQSDGYEKVNSLINSRQSGNTSEDVQSYQDVNIVPLVSLMIENPTPESRSQLHQVLQLLKDEPILQAGDVEDLSISSAFKSTQPKDFNDCSKTSHLLNPEPTEQLDGSIQSVSLPNTLSSEESMPMKRNALGIDVGIQCSLQVAPCMINSTMIQSDKNSNHALLSCTTSFIDCKIERDNIGSHMSGDNLGTSDKFENFDELSSSRAQEESSFLVNPIIMANSVKNGPVISDLQCETPSLSCKNPATPVVDEDVHDISSLSSKKIHEKANSIDHPSSESHPLLTPAKQDMTSSQKEKALSHSTSNLSIINSTSSQNISETFYSNENSKMEDDSDMLPVCSLPKGFITSENLESSHNEAVPPSTFESKSISVSTTHSISPNEEKCQSCVSSNIEMSKQFNNSLKENIKVTSSAPNVQNSDHINCTSSLPESKTIHLELQPVELYHVIKCLDAAEENMAKLNTVSNSPINNELSASLSQLRQIIQASQKKEVSKDEPICPTLLLTPETLQTDNAISSDQLSIDGVSERNVSNQVSYEINNEDALDVKTRPSSRRSFSSQLSNFFQNTSFNKSFGMSRVGPVLQREGGTSIYRKTGQDSDGSVKDLVTTLPSTSLIINQNMHSPVDHIVLSMVHAMSGEFLHKFVRKTTFSTETVHLRFFWLNPYTRVLAWARREPHFALGTRSPRQVYVTKVEEIESSYRHPTMSEDCTKAINIYTTSRVITVKANSMAYHEMWLTALSHVQSHNTQESSKYSRERHWNSIKSKDNSFIMGSDVRSVKTSLLSRPSSRTGSYSSARRDLPEETIRSVSPIYSHPEEMSGADLVSIRVSKEFVRAPKTATVTSFNESHSRSSSPQSSHKNHNPYGSLFSKLSKDNPTATDFKP